MASRSIRTPPRSALLGTNPSRGVGWCRLCAGEILMLNKAGEIVRHNRRSWHPECVSVWNIAARPRCARELVRERDHGICRTCGAPAELRYEPEFGSPPVEWVCNESLSRSAPGYGRACPVVSRELWHVDHIVPLHLVDRDAPHALKYWLLGNLQTLCTSCHGEKTAREAGVRAKVKRIQHKGGLRPNGRVLSEEKPSWL